MLSEPSDLPRQNTIEETPAWKPNGSMMPPRPVMGPSPAPETMPTLRRPGCVTVTAVMFLLLANFTLLGIMTSLLRLDLLGIIANIGQTATFLLAAYGLWQMLRWGANLAIIFGLSMIGSLLMIIVIMAFYVDELLDSSGMRIFFMAIMIGMYTIPIIFSGLVIRWYLRVRKWFMPGNLTAQQARWLYTGAVVAMLLSMLTVAFALPEAIDLQRGQFDELNRAPFSSP